MIQSENNQTGGSSAVKQTRKERGCGEGEMRRKKSPRTVEVIGVGSAAPDEEGREKDGTI